MGLDGCVARLDMTGQSNLDRRWQITCLASTLQGKAYRIRVGYASLQGLPDTGLQFGGTITIKQT